MAEEHNIKYAGFWVRLAAFIIDSLWIGIPSYLIALLISLPLGLSKNKDTGELIAVFIFIPIVVYFVTKFGATPGKKVYGLKIIMADGTYPTFGKASEVASVSDCRP